MALQSFFNDRSSKWSVFQQTLQAERILEIGIAVRSPALIGSIPPDVAFNLEQSRRAFRLAIQTDDIAVFDAVMDKLAGGNVNHVLREIVTANGYNYESEHSLLYFALDGARRNIALRLTTDQATDILHRGFVARNDQRLRDRFSFQYAETNRNLAEVSAVLTQRLLSQASRLIPA